MTLCAQSFKYPLSCVPSPPETKKSYTLNPDEKLRFTFDLQLNSCNIYFFPKSDHEHSNSRTQIVLQGRLQEGSDRLDCKGFQLQKPCGILNEAVQVSCSGRFEVRDQNDDKALEVELAIESRYMCFVGGVRGLAFFFSSTVNYNLNLLSFKNNILVYRCHGFHRI